MNYTPHLFRRTRPPESGPGRSAWRPRWTLATIMTVVAVLACVFWSVREFSKGNFLASFVVSEVLWLSFLARLIRGRSKNGRIF